MRTLLTLATSLVLFAGAAGAAPLPPRPAATGGAACAGLAGFHETAYLPGTPTPMLACCPNRTGCAQFLSTRSLVHGAHALRT